MVHYKNFKLIMFNYNGVLIIMCQEILMLNVMSPLLAGYLTSVSVARLYSIVMLLVDQHVTEIAIFTIEMVIQDLPFMSLSMITISNFTWIMRNHVESEVLKVMPRLQSSGIWYHVVWWMGANALEEPAACIFRSENGDSRSL